MKTGNSIPFSFSLRLVFGYSMLCVWRPVSLSPLSSRSSEQQSASIDLYLFLLPSHSYPMSGFLKKKHQNRMQSIGGNGIFLFFPLILHFISLLSHSLAWRVVYSRYLCQIGHCRQTNLMTHGKSYDVVTLFLIWIPFHFCCRVFHMWLSQSPPRERRKQDEGCCPLLFDTDRQERTLTQVFAGVCWCDVFVCVGRMMMRDMRMKAGEVII